MNDDRMLFPDDKTAYNATQNQRTRKNTKKGRKHLAPLEERRQNEASAFASARSRIDYTGQPIMSVLYVAPDLSWRVLTGSIAGLPNEMTDQVLPDEMTGCCLTIYTRLTRAEYHGIRQQLARLDWKSLTEDQRRRLLYRWCELSDWAAGEGWT